MTTETNTAYADFCKKTASSVRSFKGLNDMENAVWEAVVESYLDDILEYIGPSTDDGAETGHRNYAWAQANTPNFADASSLGDFEGYDMESIQMLCQDVFDIVYECLDEAARDEL